MPEYDFLTLASQDFEALVRDLLQEEIGTHIESFGPGKDGGIDLRYASGGRKVIIQAKRYSESSRSSFRKSILSDLDKVKSLNPQRYIIATTLNLSPSVKDQLVNDLVGIPICTADIYSRTDLNNLLGKYPHVEKRHFKLWLQSSAVLNRILNNATYEKSHMEIDTIRDKVKLYVDTPATLEAQRILDKHHSLIISGPPGVGKTTLARMLVLIHAANDWDIIVIDDPNEALSVFREDRNQLFLFDDFLGRTRLSSDFLNKIDIPLVRLIEKIKRSSSSRFIMTTRSYLFAQAQIVSDNIDNPNINITKMIINVENYTRSIKAQILYNHILFSGLSFEHKKAFLHNKLYKTIVDHKNYMPRLIETLTNSNFVDGSSADEYSSIIVKTLNKPTLIWEKAFNHHISSDAKVIIAALYFSKPRISLDELEKGYFSLYGWQNTDPKKATRRSFENALKELDGSFINISKGSFWDKDVTRIDFSNPSVPDFLEDEFSKANIAVFVIKNFSKPSQFKSAWEFLSRNPICKPDHNDLRILVDQACARLVSMPVREQHGKMVLIDMSIIDRLKLIFSLRDVIGTECVDKYALVLCNLMVSYDYNSADEVLNFISYLKKKWSGTPEAKSKFMSSMDKLLMDILEYKFDELSVSEIRGIHDHFDGIDIDDVIVDALNCIVQNIDSEMHNITTPEELEDFKENLLPLMSKFDIDNVVVDCAIEDKEGSFHEDDDDYGPSERYISSSGSIDSDRQMDSLFSSLIVD